MAPEDHELEEDLDLEIDDEELTFDDDDEKDFEDEEFDDEELEELPSLSDEEKLEEKEILEETKEADQKPPVKPTQPPKQQQVSSVSSQEEKTEENISLEQEKLIPKSEIPISLHIEVGRLKMSLKKLLELDEGNVLELDIKPEMGVNLVVGDQVVGKGELIRIGDTLGVRITDLME